VVVTVATAVAHATATATVARAKTVVHVKSALPASHVQKTKHLFILFLKAIRESEWLFCFMVLSILQRSFYKARLRV